MNTTAFRNGEDFRTTISKAAMKVYFNFQINSFIDEKIN